MLHRLFTHEKHRRVQIIVIAGSVICAVISVFIPEWQHVGAIAGVVTNVIWVME